MDIKALLKRPESKTLEFKRDLSSLKPILKTLVAFANTAGGVLIVGVEDNGKVVGVEDIQKQQDKLANSIADNISPKLFPEIEFFTLDKKDLLIIQVHHIPMPFYMKSEGDINGVYLRLGATSRKGPPEFLEEIKRRRLNQYFDEEPCLDAKETDLDKELISKAFADKPYKITKAKLMTLKILCEHSGKTYPTNGGVLLFGKEDKRLSLFPNTETSCARFLGIDKSEFVDRLDITESPLVALDEIPKFIRRNTRLAAEFGDIKRKDIPEYPTKAIREVLINAFIHANYEFRGSRFFVAIYSDRIEIQNPGIFPPGMTYDDFIAGISRIRNPMIARAFREKEKLEAWGSGYERIRDICENNGYPIPEWQEVGPVMRVIFHPKPLSAKKAPSKKALSTKSKSHQVKQKILAFCISTKSMKEILNHLQVTDRTKLRKNHLNPLIKDKYLKMTLPESPNSPNQKYITTTLGKKQIDKRN